MTSYDYNTCIYGASPSSQYKYPPNLKVCAKKRVVALADCEKVKFNWLMFGCFFFLSILYVINKPPWDETAFQGLDIFFRYEQIISIAYLFEFTVFMTQSLSLNLFELCHNRGNQSLQRLQILTSTYFFKSRWHYVILDRFFPFFLSPLSRLYCCLEDHHNVNSASTFSI